VTRALLVALFALLVVPPAVARAGGVTMVSRDLPVVRTHPVAARAPARFDLVGFRWQGNGAVLFRTRAPAGRWGAWQVPDDDNPSWVGPSNGLRYRTRGDVRALRAFYIRSPVEHRPLRRLSVAGSPPIVSRSAWGADELLRRNHPHYASVVRLVIVHHTATPNNYTPDQAAAIVRGIDVFHVRTRGWNDIGYNFLIDRFGRVFEGRYGGITRNVIGAHALGFNTGSVGIALIGNFTTAKPPAAAVQSLERLIAWRLDLAHVDPVSTLSYVSGGSERWRAGVKVKLRAVSGHRDTGSTTCPGDQLYAQLDRIALVAEQTGLPKLYAPLVRGKIGGQVVFSGRLSSALPWTISVDGPDGRVVARSSGVGPAIVWTWNSRGFAPGRYTWQM
jgi:N-acetylmuramoyl-L-alanine amidase